MKLEHFYIGSTCNCLVGLHFILLSYSGGHIYCSKLILLQTKPCNNHTRRIHPHGTGGHFAHFGHCSAGGRPPPPSPPPPFSRFGGGNASWRSMLCAVAIRSWRAASFRSVGGASGWSKLRLGVRLVVGGGGLVCGVGWLDSTAELAGVQGAGARVKQAEHTAAHPSQISRFSISHCSGSDSSGHHAVE